MKKVGTSIDFYHWAILIVTIGALAGPTTFVMVGLLVALLALIYHWLPGSSYDQPLSQKAGQRRCARTSPDEGAMLVNAIEAMQSRMSEEHYRENQQEQKEHGVIAESREDDGGDGESKLFESELFESGLLESKCSENVSAVTFSSFTRSIENDELESGCTSKVSALVRIAEQYLSVGDEKVFPESSTQVFLHVNANHHHIDHKIQGGDVPYVACNGTTQSVDDRMARQIICDASLIPVYEDNEGNTLSIGRKSRIVPSKMRQALSMRDTCCRFPGCTQHRYTDAHHIKHWADGGETSLDNLVMLCRYHHRLHHKGEYRLLNEAGELIFTNQRNEVISQSFYPQFSAQSTAEQLQIEIENLDQGIEIDETTALTRW